MEHETVPIISVAPSGDVFELKRLGDVYEVGILCGNCYILMIDITQYIVWI